MNLQSIIAFGTDIIARCRSFVTSDLLRSPRVILDMSDKFYNTIINGVNFIFGANSNAANAFQNFLDFPLISSLLFGTVGFFIVWTLIKWILDMIF